MRNFTIGHLPADRRSTLRAVALAYRRTKADGRKPEAVHHEAYEAAMDAYLRHLENEKPERLLAAKLIGEMIAAAVNADPQ